MTEPNKRVLELLAMPHTRRIGRYGPTTIACLIFEGLYYDNPEREPTRLVLVEHFGGVPQTENKLDDLTLHDLIEYGVNPMYGWLDEKGWQVLMDAGEDMTNLHCPYHRG